jgi:hypothetical protein
MLGMHEDRLDHRDISIYVVRLGLFIIISILNKKLEDKQAYQRVHILSSFDPKHKTTHCILSLQSHCASGALGHVLILSGNQTHEIPSSDV